MMHRGSSTAPFALTLRSLILQSSIGGQLKRSMDFEIVI